jgi:hypothetical protein
MGINVFKKETKKIDKLPPNKAQQRASQMETGGLYATMDNTIMYLGQAFDAWRYKAAPASEVQDCLEALQIIWEEIEARKQ